MKSLYTQMMDAIHQDADYIQQQRGTPARSSPPPAADPSPETRAWLLAAEDAGARFRLFEAADPAGHRVVRDLVGFEAEEEDDYFGRFDGEGGLPEAYDHILKACVCLRAAIQDGDDSLRTGMLYRSLLWSARGLMRQMIERGEI